MKYFTKQHEWFDTKTYKIGISSFAKNELGEIVYLKLPEIGQHVIEGDELCILESTKAASDVYAPFSGVVENLNQQAISYINEDPENQGWLVQIKPDKDLNLNSYLNQESYQKMLES